MSVVQLFVEFGDEVLDCVHDAKGVDVEDVRRAMVGPLRAYVDEAAAHASEMRPTPVRGSKGDADGSKADGARR